MESEFVLTAIQLNFSRSHIRRVIKRQISQHLCNFQSIEALIDALVTTPAEELTFQPAIEPRNEITNSGKCDNVNPCLKIIKFCFYKVHLHCFLSRVFASF